MRKRLFLTTTVCAAALILMSAMPGDKGVITKEGAYTVVNTTTLAQDVEGYNGPTPVKIYIKKGKVEKIEALQNEETPRYFAKVKNGLLKRWNGMTVKAARSAHVDAVTGATYSSNAVIENVHRGLDYYKKH